MTTGFYFAGMLDKTGVDTKDCEVQEPAVTVQDIRMLRPKVNVFIIAKVRPSDQEDGLMKQVMEIVEEGAMAPPKEVADVFLRSHGVARRIPHLVCTGSCSGSPEVAPSRDLEPPCPELLTYAISRG